MTDSGFVQTYTGRAFYPLAPRPGDVCIRDIAHHLSLRARWGGATRRLYSVAQHSVLVAEHLPEHLRIYGLLHDAAEAYLPDIAAPIKDAFVTRAGRSFERVEEDVLGAIFQALEIPDVALCWSNEVLRADRRAMATEKRDLLRRPLRGWSAGAKPFTMFLDAWPLNYAEDQFMAAFDALYQQRGTQ
ncbi:MAG: hypothetical protein BWX86_00588 [Verrucomicrobia bacterium ADurb.Bin122]|nr:MAG: hypothetical protein BWX86_00588 [Verrucomicrobia bacterium ADurb.Bin122]